MQLKGGVAIKKENGQGRNGRDRVLLVSRVRISVKLVSAMAVLSRRCRGI